MRSSCSSAVRAVARARRAQMAYVASAGFVPPWQPAPDSPAAKQLTLVIPRRDGRVLLGMKLRGFGQGYVFPLAGSRLRLQTAPARS